MIILLGADGSGKTTLAKQLEAKGLQYNHFTQNSGYFDYLKPLCKLEWTNAVLDRHALCEYPYSICMNREFAFKDKDWQNLILLTLMQNPVIVLCTHKPLERDYGRDQYLPYNLIDRCLSLYKEYLSSHHIPYTEYDYNTSYGDYADILIRIQDKYNAEIAWWKQHWLDGHGCIGSPNARFLLVAERLGPNNVNKIPFETGPTGHMLTDIFIKSKTPLGTIAITNMVKSFLRDKRIVNDRDLELLAEEITHIKPQKVIFMGSVAKRGIKLAKDMGCEVDTMVHLGSLNYRGVTDLTGYTNEWSKILGLLPVRSFDNREK
jgi:hypothetical protein